MLLLYNFRILWLRPLIFFALYTALLSLGLWEHLGRDPDDEGKIEMAETYGVSKYEAWIMTGTSAISYIFYIVALVRNMFLI